MWLVAVHMNSGRTSPSELSAQALWLVFVPTPFAQSSTLFAPLTWASIYVRHRFAYMPCSREHVASANAAPCHGCRHVGKSLLYIDTGLRKVVLVSSHVCSHELDAQGMLCCAGWDASRFGASRWVQSMWRVHPQEAFRQRRV